MSQSCHWINDRFLPWIIGVTLLLGLLGCGKESRVVGDTSEYTAESVAEQLMAEQAASEAADEQ